MPGARPPCSAGSVRQGAPGSEGEVERVVQTQRWWQRKQNLGTLGLEAHMAGLDLKERRVEAPDEEGGWVGAGEEEEGRLSPGLTPSLGVWLWRRGITSSAWEAKG